MQTERVHPPTRDVQCFPLAS